MIVCYRLSIFIYYIVNCESFARPVDCYPIGRQLIRVSIDSNIC